LPLEAQQPWGYTGGNRTFLTEMEKKVRFTVSISKRELFRL